MAMGYVGAWAALRDHVYREPDDLILAELNEEYNHMDYVTCGYANKITAVPDFVAKLNTFNKKLPLAHRKSQSETALKPQAGPAQLRQAKPHRLACGGRDCQQAARRLSAHPAVHRERTRAVVAISIDVNG